MTPGAYRSIRWPQIRCEVVAEVERGGLPQQVALYRLGDEVVCGEVAALRDEDWVACDGAEVVG